jgi:hypothetical protein
VERGIARQFGQASTLIWIADPELRLAPRTTALFESGIVQQPAGLEGSAQLIALLPGPDRHPQFVREHYHSCQCRTEQEQP